MGVLRAEGMCGLTAEAMGELMAEEMHVLVFEGINEPWPSNRCISVMREWVN